MKFKHSLFSLFNKISLLIISILGFACDPDDIRVEYGCPNADFKINGTVVNEVTNTKISNIRVILSDTQNGIYNRDTVYTNEYGGFEVRVNESPSTTSLMLSFDDIDGQVNGQFQSLDSIVEFNDPTFEGGDGSWYYGETSKEVNVKLTPEE